MNSETQVVELRGHHLLALGHVHEVTRDEFFRELHEDSCSETGEPGKNWVPYVHTLEDAFMRVGYDDLRVLLRNTNQRIRLVAGKPDHICVACPAKKKETCRLFNSQPKLDMPAFNFEERSESQGDIDVAEAFGLEINRDYTSREIIDALGLQGHYV